jgi:ankyrin repeat protein
MKSQAQDPLLQALEANDASAVERLLAVGRNVIEHFQFDRTPLHFAAEAGATECACLLLNRGADLEARDEFGCTPLICALSAGHANVAADLIRAGAHLRYRFKREDTPEIRARLRRTYEEVQTQSRQAAPALYRVLDAVSSDRERAELAREMTESLIETTLAESEIHAVHHCANLECLKLLALQPGVSFNLHDGAGYWPLKTSVESGDAPAVEWLLKNGADPNFTSTGDSALHAAVSGNDIECARLLLQAGGDPNQQDVDGCVPMWRVATDEMLDLLLAHGADPTIGDQCGFRPSHWVSDRKVKARLKKLERQNRARIWNKTGL